MWGAGSARSKPLGFQPNHPRRKCHLVGIPTAFSVPILLLPHSHFLSCVDLSQSFYVGDAAGRPTDFIDNATGMPSDVDRQFARNAQLEFKLPEELFGQ